MTERKPFDNGPFYIYGRCVSPDLQVRSTAGGNPLITQTEAEYTEGLDGFQGEWGTPTIIAVDQAGAVLTRELIFPFGPGGGGAAGIFAFDISTQEYQLVTTPAYANPSASITYGFKDDPAGGPPVFDQIRTQSPFNIAASVKDGSLITTLPATWAINHEPATNVQATITRAAGGAGVVHIATSISGEFSVDTAGVPARVFLRLRDGASGAGTILWSQGMSFAGMPVGTSARVFLSGLQIPGTANTAMTLEFSAAGGAATFESVALTGFDVSN